MENIFADVFVEVDEEEDPEVELEREDDEGDIWTEELAEVLGGADCELLDDDVTLDVIDVTEFRVAR